MDKKPILPDKFLCTGCGACACSCPKDCLTMVADAEGFPYPVPTNPTACIHCNVCAAVCPVNSPASVPERKPQAYAAYCTDNALRMDSSSGGLFSLLALNVLSSGGCVFGAAYDDAFRVTHICVDDASQLFRLRGAKYAQSNLRSVFREVKEYLQEARLILFSGTPCQVAGLKSYLGREYENLICVDFVCHGVPSPLAWETYVTYRSEKDHNGQLPISINLRSKETGWSRYQYCNTFTYPSGKTHIAKNGDSSFMQLFVGNYISRPSCENCSFKGYSRSSDITIGDFWGIWDISPDMDDNKGTSVVLLHTEKAASHFHQISEQLVYRPVTLEQTSIQNPSMLVSSPANPMRSSAFSALQNGDWDKCASVLLPPPTTTYKKVKRLLLRLLKNNLS